LANNFGLPLSFGGCLVAQRIAPIYATDLFERMGRSALAAVPAIVGWLDAKKHQKNNVS